jgi:hypothetical protein
VSEQGRAAEALGIRVGYQPGDGGRERATLIVRKWDGDQTAWTSRKLGGESPGRAGFVQPHARDFKRFGVDPYDVSEAVGNLITQAGWGRLLTLGVGGGGTAYASASTRIGVGTATAAATTGQTDLSAATGGTTNRLWVMGTGVGTTGTGTGTARLTIVGNTVGSGDGNFAWAEWGIDQGTASGAGLSTATLLNRAVSALGTKASPATWTATALLDFT